MRRKRPVPAGCAPKARGLPEGSLDASAWRQGTWYTCASRLACELWALQRDSRGILRQVLDMREIYFGNFRLMVVQQIREIQAQEPEDRSVEWFLLKYLRRIEKNANPPTTPGSMENSVRALVRFYVDMVDERSELGERCRYVYEQYRKTLREDQNRE